jgi:hypothetical protein
LKIPHLIASCNTDTSCRFALAGVEGGEVRMKKPVAVAVGDLRVDPRKAFGVA